MQISSILSNEDVSDEIFAFVKLRREEIMHAMRGILPGVHAHDHVLGYERPSVSDILKSDKEPRHSAVVFLLYPWAEEWHFLLLKRHDYKGVHSGQVGLPGGRLEKGETKQEAMVRELYEETGYELSSVDIIGELTPLYIPPSNFIVHPFSAIIDERPDWKFDEREVRRGIETPLERLLHPDILEEHQVPIGEGKVRIDVKRFPFGGESVWGATAMILSECKQILSKFSP